MRSADIGKSDLQEQSTKGEQAAGAHYAFKPSLMGAAHQFELTDAKAATGLYRDQSITSHP